MGVVGLACMARASRAASGSSSRLHSVGGVSRRNAGPARLGLGYSATIGLMRYNSSTHSLTAKRARRVPSARWRVPVWIELGE